MAAYLDKRDGKTWRYAKMVRLPGTSRSIRIAGTPKVNTKVAAEHAEALHIHRLMYPDQAKPEPSPSKPGGRFPTVREFAKRFLAEYDPTGANRSKQSRRSKVHGTIVPFLGHLRLDEITQSHVNAFVATMAGRSAGTINNTLAVLSTLLTYAADDSNGELELPPLKLRVSKKASKKASIKVRAITRPEVARLLHATRGDARYQVAILLAVEAGLRIGEIRALQWTDIKGRTITVQRSIDSGNVEGPPKNGTPRTIGPITDALHDALQALPRRAWWVITPLPKANAKRPERYLCYKGMLTRIKRAYAEARITMDASIDPWHSLRHTYGTELHSIGVTIQTIMYLMGHADITTTQRYITTTADQMAAAMRRLNDR